tara:strand:- start:1761 stop:1880 length:120 start_codon:yes stop_codon:yes gene_type:complete
VRGLSDENNGFALTLSRKKARHVIHVVGFFCLSLRIESA